jgi:glycosyltransferase involved in cell wall biosynthesis
MEWHNHHKEMTSFIMEYASGIIVASEAVRERVERELKRHQRRSVKTHLAHLPPASIFLSQPFSDPSLRAHSYFVMCGTIETRKNHHLILEIWRRFERNKHRQQSRLILIGKRGWKNDHTFSLLDNDSDLRCTVLEAGAVPDPIQHWLVANACAVLFPSRAEGYGLPLVEALSVGTPVVASEIPVMRETTQGCATFCPLDDVESWRHAIRGLSSRSTTAWAAAQAKAHEFRPTTPAGYFTSIFDFLDTL